MIATFYNFKKKSNSTKTVSGNGTVVNFVYKLPTEEDNPTIELTNWNDWNYAKIGYRYFFVDNVEHIANNLHRVTLICDFLATYKREILSTNARVLYSANNYSMDLIDERIKSTGKNLVGFDAKTMEGLSDTGTFFITTLNTSDDGGEFTTTYNISYSQLRELVTKLSSNDLTDELIKFWDNPFEAIVDLYWLPISNGAFWFPTGNHTLRIGDWDSYIPCGILNFKTNEFNTKSITFEIPWQYNDFRNLEPYTSINLYLPAVGVVTLSPSDLYNTDKLFIEYSVDAFSGNVGYQISTNHENVIGVFSGNLKVELPTGSSIPRVHNYLNYAAGLISAGATVLTGNLGLAAGIGAYAVANSQNQRQYSMNGAFNGSILNTQFFANKMIYMWVVSKETYVAPSNLTSVVGSPCGRVLPLSECVGYTKTVDASVAITGHKYEMDRINNLLDGGVYIE